MIISCFIAIYVLCGALVARVVFSRLLRDAPRRNKYGEFSNQHSSAVGTAIFTFIGWPLALPLLYVFRTTAMEKAKKDLDERTQKVKESESRMKEWDKLREGGTIR